MCVPFFIGFGPRLWMKSWRLVGSWLALPNRRQPLGHSAIPLQLLLAPRRIPAKDRCHLFGDCDGDLISIVIVVIPARSANHHVVKMHRPFMAAILLDRRRRRLG